jgi:transcriptional regulator with XRE-family HTH domain
MIIKMSISENIKSLRAQHGMSQDEFGKIAGLTGKAVSTWENGTKEPRLGAIQKLADYFHISKSEIIEGPVEKEKSAAISDELILQLYNKLTDENKQKILELARLYVDGQEQK